MFRKTNNICLAILLGIAALGFACGGQTDEANKLVNEGNAIIAKNNEVTAKKSSMITELLGENMTKAEDLEKYKADNKAKFDELGKTIESAEKGFNDAAAKFEAAAKLNVDEKFKEYLNVTVQEFKKRAEIEKNTGTFLKAFLAEKDAEKADALVGDYNTKSASMKKEADDLTAKADKIMKDNPSVFNTK
jgi:hypothetical protein